MLSSINACSAALLDKVRYALMPGVRSDDIILCAPYHTHTGDYQVGVCLYDIQDFSAMQTARPVYTPADESTVRRTLAPKLVELHYLLYTNETARFNQYPFENGHRILTRLVDCVHSAPYLQTQDMPLAFSFLSVQDKISLWHGFTKPMQAALYLTAGPVPIDGSLCEIIPLTRDMSLHTHKKDETGGGV